MSSTCWCTSQYELVTVGSQFSVDVVVLVITSVIVKPAELRIDVVSDVNTDTLTVSHTHVETFLLCRCRKHAECSKRRVVLARQKERLSPADCC